MIHLGKLWLEDGCWRIRTQPHVVIRLKAILRKIDRTHRDILSVVHSPETATDLHWFISRYPHEMSDADRSFLSEQAASHAEHVSDLERIRLPEYQPRSYELAHPLRHYQSVAADLFLSSGKLLLADDVGLGKSAVAIAAGSHLDCLPMLVVCQAHLPRQWKNEICKFIPHARVHMLKKGTPYELPPSDVIISTYHKLSGWADVLSRMVKTVVFDEVQELRIPNSQKYRSARQLSEMSQRRIGLSATPIGNYGGEMFHVMEMIAPGALGTHEEFMREWCDRHGMHVRLRDPDAFGSWLMGESLMLRRTRRDVGRELPAVQRIIHTVEHRADVLEKIAGNATELARLILGGTFLESGQAAREFDSMMRQATGIAKAPYVAQFVKMLVDEGDQVLLAGWHREVYSIWMEALDEFYPVLYTGTESPSQKEKSFQSFTDGHSKVMIISNRSGSGLNGLERVCNVLVQGELDWSPAVMEQMIGRLNRDGMDQSKHVTAFYLLSDAGSDPLMAEIIGLKRVESFRTLNPGQSMDGLGRLQVESDRIKELARRYLDRKAHTKQELMAV